MNPNIILASFAARLGASPVLIGLVPALPLAGGLLPQALLVGWVARHGRKLPLYRRASAFRFAGLLLLVFGAFFLGAWPGLLLGVFLAGLFLFALFTAVASLPYWEVLAKAVPREERPGLFAAIYMGGGVLAFLAGFGVRALLGLDLPFPLGYALLFALGTLAYGAAWYVFGRVEEPEEEVAVGRTDLRLPLRRPGFRAYLTARLFLGLAGMVEPFYAAYAVRVLGKEAELGLYLALNALAFILSNALWSALARRGAKAVFLGGGVLVLATPSSPSPFPPGPSPWSSSCRGPTLPPWASPATPTSSTWPRPRSGPPPWASPTASWASSPSPRSSEGGWWGLGATGRSSSSPRAWPSWASGRSGGFRRCDPTPCRLAPAWGPR